MTAPRKPAAFRIEPEAAAKATGGLAPARRRRGQKTAHRER